MVEHVWTTSTGARECVNCHKTQTWQPDPRPDHPHTVWWPPVSRNCLKGRRSPLRIAYDEEQARLAEAQAVPKDGDQ